MIATEMIEHRMPYLYHGRPVRASCRRLSTLHSPPRTVVCNPTHDLAKTLRPDDRPPDLCRRRADRPAKRLLELDGRRADRLPPDRPVVADSRDAGLQPGHV